jgi:hypothetical protein
MRGLDAPRRILKPRGGLDSESDAPTSDSGTLGLWGHLPIPFLLLRAKQNAPDYTSPRDVKLNSPPPKSAQSQSTVKGPGGEGHVRNKCPGYE